MAPITVTWLTVPRLAGRRFIASVVEPQLLKFKQEMRCEVHRCDKAGRLCRELIVICLMCCSGVITSPTRCSSRADWLASHQLPANGRLFTLVAGLRPVKDPLYLLQTFSCKISLSCLSCWPASVAQVTETQCAPTGTVCRRSRGSIPGSAGRFRIWISGAHALILISRAGKEGSTVSSIVCGRWLILS